MGRRGGFGGLAYLVFVGAGLIGFGAWMALAEIGAPVPDLEQGWPAFPIYAGLAFWLGWLLDRRAFGLVLPGTLAILTGAFFLPFSFGLLDWSAMERYWPVFPLIVGLAFVAMWIAARLRYWGLLIPAGIFLSAGIIALPITATPFGSVVEIVGWPVAILAVGATVTLIAMLVVVVRTLRRVAGAARPSAR
jgi:hypothetical protein